jgi:hypothetical protein
MSVTGEVVSTKQVPKSLGCFFEEEGLPLAAFASTSDITRGLAQMGISDRTLATIAVKLKTQVSADRRFRQHFSKVAHLKKSVAPSRLPWLPSDEREGHFGKMLWSTCSNGPIPSPPYKSRGGGAFRDWATKWG